MSLSLAAIARKSHVKLSGIPYCKRAARVAAAGRADILAQHPGKLLRRWHQREVALEARRDTSGDYFHIPK